MTMKKLLLALGVILLLGFLQMLPQLTDYFTTCSAKTGIVIDKETGKPMPNVLVMAVGWYWHGPVYIGQGGTQTLYRIVTTTNEQGRYRIPAQYSGNGVYVFGVIGEYHWRWAVTAFEPGYVVDGDNEPPPSTIPDAPYYRPILSNSIPPYSLAGLHFEVEPIRLFKPELSLEEAAVYYARIKSSGSLHSKPEHTFASEPLRVKGYAYLAPWVCSMDPEQSVNARTAMSLLAFSEYWAHASQLMDTLAPHFYTADKMAVKDATTTAAVACLTITNGRGNP